MTVRELREKFLRFFQSKGHAPFPSGSLVPYDVTGRLDESLLFNGAGMVQFKPYFRGIATPPQPRLVTCQKVVRTGDIDSVGNLIHHTFFEMLGNFSFGDYFKADAIAYSWEFMTSAEWLGLDPRKLSFTVFEEDDAAHAAWSGLLAGAGIDPATRLFRLGEETNYWPAGAFSSGPPGPCGPNTEMFYWTAGDPPTGPYTREDWLRDDAARNWLEIWNDVFIQFEWQGDLRNPNRPQEGYAKSGMPPLPFSSVDTGMGLERTAAVLSGKRSTYDTDVFAPILDAISRLAGRPYGSDAANAADAAMRIIADHIRTAVFCIADGVLPGNSGRGYVLRRLIRRAVLKGLRGLAIDRPFFHEVYEGVVIAMGDFYPELVERRATIVETLRNEEALFRRTLHQGAEVLERELAKINLPAHLMANPSAGYIVTPIHPAHPKILPGEIAFRLYDTYGFPLEVTKELCQEVGVAVDEIGYEKALVEAQERSRRGTDRESVYGGVQANIFVQIVAVAKDRGDQPTETVFRGYDALATASTIVGALKVGEEAPRLVIALDQTPFYAESGGQISDTGVLRGDGFEARVVDVTKQNGVFVHDVEVRGEVDPDALFGKRVEAQVDENRRRRITRNHTATHLLHAALRGVLGKHVTQAGSYVGPDYLRFDFTHGKPMSPEEWARVELLVNQEVLKNTPIAVHPDLPIEEARARGAMALFGEKYGDRVRMVEVGDFSRELCGGVHVRSTGEIGLFKILSEGSAASGVRRIEAVTGEGAYAWVLEQTGQLYEAASHLKTTPKDVLGAIERLQEQLREERRKRERVETALAKGDGGGAREVQAVGDVALWTRRFEDVDQKVAAGAIDDAVAQNPDLVAIGALVSEGRVAWIAKCGSGAVAKGAHAGNLVRELAKMTGGGGGGRAEFATAGGKETAKVDEALGQAPSLLAGQLGSGADERS